MSRPVWGGWIEISGRTARVSSSQIPFRIVRIDNLPFRYLVVLNIFQTTGLDLNAIISVYR